jgi:hypothetical protein
MRDKLRAVLGPKFGLSRAIGAMQGALSFVEKPTPPSPPSPQPLMERIIRYSVTLPVLTYAEWGLFQDGRCSVAGHLAD